MKRTIALSLLLAAGCARAVTAQSCPDEVAVHAFDGPQ